MKSKIINFESFVINESWVINKYHDSVLESFPLIEKFLTFISENITKKTNFIGTCMQNEKTSEIYSNTHLILSYVIFKKFYFNQVIEPKIIDQCNIPFFQDILNGKTNEEIKPIINYFSTIIDLFKQEYQLLGISEKNIKVFLENIELNLVQGDLNDSEIIANINNEASLYNSQSISVIFEQKLMNFLDEELLNKKFEEIKQIINIELKKIYSRNLVNQTNINNMDSLIYGSLIMNDLALLGQTHLTSNYLNLKYVASIKIHTTLELNFLNKNKTIEDFKQVLTYFKKKFLILSTLANKNFTNFTNISSITEYLLSEIIEHSLPLEFVAAYIDENSEFKNDKIHIQNSQKIDNDLRILLSFLLRTYMNEGMTNINQSGIILLQAIISASRKLEIKEIIKFACENLKKLENEKKIPNFMKIDTILEDEYVSTFLKDKPINNPALNYLLPKLISMVEVIKYKRNNKTLVKNPILINLPMILNQNKNINESTSLGTILPTSFTEYEKFRKGEINSLDIFFLHSSKSFSHLMKDLEIQKIVTTKLIDAQKIAKRTEMYISLFQDVLKIN